MEQHIIDHPMRYALSNELHARPFPAMSAPCRAAFIALKRPTDAASRDKDADRKHLIALLDRHGAAHPQPGATHYFGEIGKAYLKWESHTEFVTYTLFGEGVAERPFDGSTFSMFPKEWLKDAPGTRLTSALVRVEEGTTDADISPKLRQWFVPESLAVSRVLDGSAVIAADFRIDSEGHMRFAVFVPPETNARTVGQIIQRMCEIETYKTMSMLGFARAREISRKLGEFDEQLREVVNDMENEVTSPETTLNALLPISAKLENLLAQTAFRFAGTGAYETIVAQRIEVLREERFEHRQTFAEFMLRRFDPAMRTVRSMREQLTRMAERATRVGELLRTRVDVERSAQNQKVLESMDRRADVQLQLQKTVEGLSVVAISYYAVNLATYALWPIGSTFGLEKYTLTALLTPAVILGVWAIIRKIRNSAH
ncbi:DUF3422 family protein [Cochlodiniinecator piscidefendens]|uniref:DUF3422 family protein n=1 Tax=Cochlodiniinecator piscidefendens TaxID=2715756 RepID=UPI0014082A79|nr:DUF3422 domain-containing protein [Cochlodiniinecator piscidefendens]